MSHFMFGEFDSDCFSEQMQESAKREFQNKGLDIVFNQDVNFCDDIGIMLVENGGGICNRFCITSVKQKCNSDGAIFPDDKYSTIELFPNGDDRTAFNEICETHIRILKDAFSRTIEIMQINRIRIFVVDGYDTHFATLCCSLDHMFEDILSQVKTSFSLESTIYEIELH